MENKDRIKAYLAYASVCFFWGTTYGAIRIGVEVMPPALFAGIRFFLAGLVLLQRLRVGMGTVGGNMEANVLLAVVNGGTCMGCRFGTVIGGLLGAVFVVLLQHYLIMANVSVFWQHIVTGALLLVGGGLCYGYYALVGMMYRNRLKAEQE